MKINKKTITCNRIDKIYKRKKKNLVNRFYFFLFDSFLVKILILNRRNCFIKDV